MPNTSKPNKVTLQTPVTIDGKNITEITLRTPTVGELRGLSVASILQMEVSTLSTMFERITQPVLSPMQISKLDPADFTTMAVQTMLFFAPKNQIKDLGMK